MNLELNRLQFDQLRHLAMSESVRDVTHVSEQAKAFLDDASWNTLQAAKQANQFVTICVQRDVGETGRLGG